MTTDAREVTDFVRRFLRSAGYEVVEVKAGERAGQFAAWYGSFHFGHFATEREAWDRCDSDRQSSAAP